MFSSKDFEKLCTPAKLYFALAILSILLGLFSGFHFMAILMKLIFAVIYTFILGWLCKKGWKGLAWFLVLLPYVLILLMMFYLKAKFNIIINWKQLLKLLEKKQIKILLI
jgi:uncharacterized membrane protein (Fun14 family)